MNRKNRQLFPFVIAFLLGALFNNARWAKFLSYETLITGNTYYTDAPLILHKEPSNATLMTRQNNNGALERRDIDEGAHHLAPRENSTSIQVRPKGIPSKAAIERIENQTMTKGSTSKITNAKAEANQTLSRTSPKVSLANIELKPMQRRRRRQANVKPNKPKKRHQPNEELNVSNLTLAQQTKLARQLRRRRPIIAAGLPKTGTTSLHKYFSSVKVRGIFRSSHTFTKLINGTKPRAGACMQERLEQQRPMLQHCGQFQVWSDSGYARAGDCFYPLWHALDEFVEQYPSATIIINTRNATEWTRSIQKWAKGSLAFRWNKCRKTPALPKTLEASEWIEFYELYHARIRSVCAQHESLTCIEFDIGDPNAGNILQREFGIPASHWRNCNPKDWTCRS